MPTFTPVDNDPFAAPASTLAGGATLTPVDHDPFAAAPTIAAAAPTLTPVDHDPFAPAPESAGVDVLKSGGVGLVKGTTGLLGTPGNLSDALGNAVEYVGQRALKWAGALPDSAQPQSYADIAAENAKLSQGTNLLPRSSDYDTLVQDAAGPYRQPQTRLGEYAQTVGEFAPSAALGGSGAVERAVGGVLAPAMASETAGQITKGTAYEPYARFMAALAGNAGAAGVSAYTSAPTRAVTEALGDITPAQLAAARDLQATGARIGVPLSGPEAIQQATGGATKLGDLLRFTEGTQRGGAVTAPFFAQRPAQVATAGNTTFDAIAPASAQPAMLGPQSAALAQQALEVSPEGQALRSALNAVGPQTSAADAGSVIQPALRGVYDQRAQVRADQADADYGAARAAPADTDVATLPQYAAPPVRSPSYRYDTDEDGYALVPNSGRAPPAYPLAGPDRTGMVQLDPRQIAGHIDSELQTAKGTTATALRQVRGMLATNGGLDTSVEGVGNVRNAVNTMISTAQRNGDGPTAQSLTGVRDQIDEVLSDVPAYETARANYAQNSLPLRPFEDPALGKVIAQDGFGSLFTTSPDAVPQALQSGGTRSADAFNQVATPAARTALRQLSRQQARELRRRPERCRQWQAVESSSR